MNSCNTRQDLGCRGSADEVPGAEETHQRKQVGEAGALSGPLRPACLSGLIPRQSLPLPTPAASHSPHMSCPFPPPALCSQSTPLLESLQKGRLSLIPHILAQLLPDSFTDTPGTPALCLSLSRTFRHWKTAEDKV